MWRWLPHWYQAIIVRQYALIYPAAPFLRWNEFDRGIKALRCVCWQFHDLVDTAMVTWLMYRRFRINDLAVLKDERDDEVRAAADTQDFAKLARRRMPEAFVLIVGASRVSHAEAHRLLSPDADWYRAFAHYAHLVHGDGGLQNAYPRARWMVYQVVHGAQLGAAALAQLRLLMQGRVCDALAHYRTRCSCIAASTKPRSDTTPTRHHQNDLALELGSPGCTGGELEEGEIPSRVEQSVWPSGAVGTMACKPAGGLALPLVFSWLAQPGKMLLL